MGDRICSIDGCERVHYGRGWCQKHYQRWRANGDSLVARQYMDPEEAFVAYARRQGACLVWTGSIHHTGYGSLRVDGRSVQAHRYAWERVHGPIPDGMVIDHTCWNKACVNVDHLRLASYLENGRYRNGPQSSKRDGARNVYREGNRWRVIIGYHNKLLRFGTYQSLDEAIAVAEKNRRELFGKFAGRGGRVRKEAA